MRRNSEWRRGQKPGVTEEQIDQHCQRAYGAMTSSCSLHVMWLDRGAPRLADADTTLDFDINTTDEIDDPYRALVPSEEESWDTKSPG